MKTFPPAPSASPGWPSDGTTSARGVLELAATFDRLGAKDSTLRSRIAQLLGREWPPNQADMRPSQDNSREPSSPPTLAPFETPPASQIVSPATPTGTTQNPSTTVELRQPLSGGALELLGDAPSLPSRPRSLPLDFRKEDFAPALAPLLRPREQRAVFVSALETPLLDGGPDVEEWIEHLLKGQSLHEIPRLARGSLHLGVQVLVDWSVSMRAFYQDQQQLLEALRQVVGPSVEVLYFSRDPRRAGAGPGYTWVRYQAPRPGTPVLILSDLGQSLEPMKLPGAFNRDGQSLRLEKAWLAIADELEAQQSPRVVLTPLRPSAYPPKLARAFALLEWDQATTAQQARRARRAGGTHG